MRDYEKSTMKNIVQHLGVFTSVVLTSLRNHVEYNVSDISGLVSKLGHDSSGCRRLVNSAHWPLFKSDRMHQQRTNQCQIGSKVFEDHAMIGDSKILSAVVKTPVKCCFDRL